MRDQRWKTWTALLTAGVLFLSPVAMLCSHADEAEAETPQEFVIATTEDWAEFAELSHTDAWSQGRTVRLTADLNFSGEDTPRIAYFSGVFEGGDHEISGFNLLSEHSDAGLFDIVAPTGQIRKLSVIGAFTPRGRQVHVGGIAGINRGVIEGCSFFGNVTAHSEAGGIVGRNEDSGVIRDCMARGVVEGDSSVGGIAGYNSGLLQGCINEAMVNTVYTDVPFSTDDLTLALDAILQTGRITTPDNADQKTDIGGVAGLSIGTVDNCSNKASIGYEHVGYNIGGIAGRSTGLVRGCTNSGMIQGRRDVGGIVGQQQPDLEILFSESSLARIDTGLDDLQRMIDSALSDTEGYSNEASDLLLEISRLAGTARSDVQTITDDAANRADYEAARMNRTTSDIRNSAGELSNASDDLHEAGDRAIDYAKHVASTGISGAEATVGPMLDEILARYYDIRYQTELILADPEVAASADTENAGFYLAVLEVQSIIQPVLDAGNGSAAGEKDAILNQAFGPGREDFLKNLTSVQLGELETRLDAIQGALTPYTGMNAEVDAGLDVLLAELSVSWQEAHEGEELPGFDELENNVSAIKAEKYSISDSISALREIEASALSNAASTNRDDLTKAGESLNKAYEHVDDALERLAGIDVSMNGVSATARAASNELYLTLDSMLNRADALNMSVRGATAGTVGNLKEINAQMGYLSDLMQEAVETQLNRSTDPADYTKDVSAESFADATRGRTTACRNEGKLLADSDVGGIIGYMGVDMQLDPERDIQTMTNRTTDATMLEKDIIDSCENTGSIESRGNYAGGIVGRMLIGIAVENVSLGPVSTDGEYAGGVAGFSGAALKGNLVKTEVRASAYAGGVAGSGTVLTDNRVMVQILDAMQYAGAIAGKVDTVSEDKLSGNLYCGGRYRAIADVDYAALAQETDHETLSQGDRGIYQTLRLTFYDEDEIIRVVEVDYGDDAPDGEIPAVPVRDGFVGIWSDTGYKDITEEKRIEAEYTRTRTLIQAGEKRDDGQILLMAEGSFAPGDEIGLQVLERDETQEVLRAALPAGQGGMHTWRFLPDPAMGEVEIWLIRADGTMEKKETSTMGRYLTFSHEGESVTIRAVKKDSLLKRVMESPAAIPAAVGAGVLLILLFVFAVLRRKKKKKDSSGSPAEDPGREG